MKIDEAISLIKNTAFLGYNGDDDKMAEAIQTIEQLVGKTEQLEKERDAAVGDLRNEANCYGDLCYFCTKNGKGLCEKCRWEWRGIDG